MVFTEFGKEEGKRDVVGEFREKTKKEVSGISLTPTSSHHLAFFLSLCKSYWAWFMVECFMVGWFMVGWAWLEDFG